jgi:hypothetical protein
MCVVLCSSGRWNATVKNRMMSLRRGFWSPYIGEEYGLRVFENRLLRRSNQRGGDRWKAYRVLVGKCEGKRLLGRPIHRWDVNIKLDHKEIGWEGTD